VHGYFKLTCLFDPLTREGKGNVNLTLVRCLLSFTYNAYIGNRLHIVIRLLYEENSKIIYKTQSFFLKELN
jgi:hypothetical protein